MWLGVMHYAKAPDGMDVPAAILVAYEPHRLFTVGAPVEAAPTLIRLLREASGGGAHVRPPRCGRCGEPLEVPPLDEPEAACASA
ncbi:MAG: hypothetical protein QOI80_3347 [Solirubrobacteraceae bacterium]|jgi:hypothetical protein|nr:hypothetical protein [Solirubrobacteraceae bacterium]